MIPSSVGNQRREPSGLHPAGPHRPGAGSGQGLDGARSKIDPGREVELPPVLGARRASCTDHPGGVRPRAGRRYEQSTACPGGADEGVGAGELVDLANRDVPNPVVHRKLESRSEAQLESRRIGVCSRCAQESAVIPLDVGIESFRGLGGGGGVKNNISEAAIRGEAGIHRSGGGSSEGGRRRKANTRNTYRSLQTVIRFRTVFSSPRTKVFTALVTRYLFLGTGYREAGNDYRCRFHCLDGQKSAKENDVVRKRGGKDFSTQSQEFFQLTATLASVKFFWERRQVACSSFQTLTQA
jgi:hypothetical protein